MWSRILKTFHFQHGFSAWRFLNFCLQRLSDSSSIFFVQRLFFGVQELLHQLFRFGEVLGGVVEGGAGASRRSKADRRALRHTMAAPNLSKMLMPRGTYMQKDKICLSPRGSMIF